MNNKKILICDDDPERIKTWKRQLESAQDEFEVQGTSTQTTFVDAISDLERRRKLARRKSSQSPKWGTNLLDQAAILIVDFDLLKMSQQSYLTGENVAYLARCYSRCGLIIGLNQFGSNEFDLTLKGHSESYADLNLAGQQLANRGLWQQRKWSGFRPWYWPLIPDARAALERRAETLIGHLDDPVMKFLDFPEDVSNGLPRTISEFLGPRTKPQETTFRHFVTKPGNGLRRKDKPLDDKSIARIAAARVSKWLERLVLPGQGILVDAPHLVSRFPSLLTGNHPAELATWDKTTTLGRLSSLGVRHHAIESCRFKMEHWLSRPAWFWQGVTKIDEIKEVRKPWSTEETKKRTDYVFCEDISRFLPRAAVREFVADLPSEFVRRFVVDLNSGAGKKLAPSLKGVLYRPGVRFSL